MHFEQPTPRLSCPQTPTFWLWPSRLMAVPRMLDADACYVYADALRYTVPMLAPTHADALHAAL